MSEYAQGPILLAVDFSPDSEAAYRWAARAARLFPAPLVVLHVVHDPESAPGSYANTDPTGRLLPLEEAARRQLDEFLAKMRVDPAADPTVEPSVRLASGLPANRILEVAVDEGAQLIVVGSRGRTGLEHLLLGSKAERVARLSPVPVTIVKHPKPDR